ncbi:MAG: hypothetical protein IPQ07_30655 [Myxococcales bacterium]|nr:hypothetical protein [Myxococcales bacterium]
MSCRRNRPRPRELRHLGSACAAAGDTRGDRAEDTPPPITPPPSTPPAPSPPPASSPPPAPPAVTVDPATPKVQLAVVAGTELRFVETGPTGLVITRTVTLPGAIETLRWAGAEPVVLLSSDASDPDADRAHFGEIGKITATGYVPFPRLPEATWKMPKPKNTDDHQDPPRWHLYVTASQEIWQGRCEWGFVGEGMDCDAWIYARLAPGPLKITRKEPSEPRPRGLPKIAASKRMTLALAKFKPRVAPDGSKRKPYDILKCTLDGKTVELPADHETDGSFDSVAGFTWLRTEPPMIQVRSTFNGLYPGLTSYAIYEGCDKIDALDSAAIIGGPKDMIAIHAFEPKRVTVHWKGQLIGTLPDADFVSFAP